MDVDQLARVAPPGQPAPPATGRTPTPTSAGFQAILVSTAAAHAARAAATRSAPQPAEPAPAPPVETARAHLLQGPGGLPADASAAPVVLVRRHGVEFHVYGSGKDRQVVQAPPQR